MVRMLINVWIAEQMCRLLGLLEEQILDLFYSFHKSPGLKGLSLYTYMIPFANRFLANKLTFLL